VNKMPKHTEPLLTKMKRFVREFGDVLIINTDQMTKTHVLYCQCCEVVVNCDRKTLVQQHINTGKHKNKVKDFKSKQNTVQNLLIDKQKQFKSDLCEFMVSLNIPFCRLLKPAAKKFFNEYVKYKIPDPSTLWKYDLKPLYEKTIEKIRESLKNEYIWLQIDETDDPLKRKVTNVLVGNLTTNEENKVKFLIDMRFLDKTNNFTITQSINNALNILWPEGIQYDRVLLLVTDAAPYMKLAGKTLCETYPNLTHVTCVCHGLHNVCEFLVTRFKEVNRLISCGKKIFKKAPNRINLYKEMYNNLPLPPEPVITRWGSWLRSVEYYAKHFTEFSNVVKMLDSEDSAFIEETKELIKCQRLKNDITFIHSNFNCLAKAITQLEKSNLSLNESLNILDSVKNKLQSSAGESAKEILNKFNNVFNKNKGLKRIEAINDILNGKNDVNLDLDLNPEAIASFKFCPTTSCDTERDFSKFKFILNDRRFKFEEKNLKYYLIIHCNNQ
jgi:uncharacterized protein YoxC